MYFCSIIQFNSAESIKFIKIFIVSLPPRTDNVKRKIQESFIKAKEDINIQYCTVSVAHMFAYHRLKAQGLDCCVSLL